MTRLTPLALVFAAVGTLTACSTPPQTGGPARPPTVVTNVHPYTAGNGVVQSVTPVPAVSASAGSTAQPMQRLEIKMDNGTVQYVDTTSRDFPKGTRVTLTQDRFIKRS